MRDGRALAQRADIVHVANKRLAVEFAPGDGLGFGLKNVDVVRRAVLDRQLVRGGE